MRRSPLGLGVRTALAAALSVYAGAVASGQARSPQDPNGRRWRVIRENAKEQLAIDSLSVEYHRPVVRFWLRRFPGPESADSTIPAPKAVVKELTRYEIDCASSTVRPLYRMEYGLGGTVLSNMDFGKDSALRAMPIAPESFAEDLYGLLCSASKRR